MDLLIVQWLRKADLQLSNLALVPAGKTLPCQSVLERDTGAAAAAASNTSHNDEIISLSLSYDSFHLWKLGLHPATEFNSQVS